MPQAQADPWAQLTFAQLRSLRQQFNDDPLAQKFLAPYEHQAFAREYTEESPGRAIGLLGAIPGYQLAKLLGMMQSRTGSGDALNQMQSGFRGMGEGFINLMQR